MKTPVKVAGHTVLVLLGLVVGTAGSLVQGGWFPVGLLLALLATAALFYGGLRATDSQLGVVTSLAGWLVAVIVLSLGRDEGDKLFWGGLADLVYVLGGMTLAVIIATLSGMPQQQGPARPLGK